ncbi:hypothetical protein ADUPG1_010879, partial [Aduncisulcus paluster]
SSSECIPLLFSTGVALGMFHDIKEMKSGCILFDASSAGSNVIETPFRNEGNLFTAQWERSVSSSGSVSSTKVVLKFIDLPSVPTLSLSSSSLHSHSHSRSNPHSQHFRTLLRSALTARTCGDCPFIVPLLCAFRDEHVKTADKNGAYLVFPFYRQGDMIKWIKSCSPSVSQVRHVLKCVLHALSSLHVKGIVHCDLKPQNVLIDGDGNGLLCDFEGAVDCGERTVRLFSQTMRIGSRGYIAPELERTIKDKKEHPHPQPWSDMFAFGVLIEAVFDLLQGVSMPDDVRSISSACQSEDPQHRPTAADLLAKM